MKQRTDEFRQRLAEAGAQWREDGSRVERYGAVEHEYWAVRDGGLGLMDRSERETLVVRGEDTIPWLQGLVTSDLMELREEGSGQRSSVVSRVGKAIADLRLLHLPELLLIDLEEGSLSRSDLLGHLRRHVITERVTIADRSAQVARLTLTGRRVAALLDQAAELEREASSLPLYAGTWGKIGDDEIVAQRVELTGEMTLDLSCDVGAAHRVWGALMAASPELRVVGHEAGELLRLEAGVVSMDGVEYHDKIIPIEANLNATISYTKGCYLGQEVIHRLDTRGKPAKRLRALLGGGDGATLQLGAEIRDEAGKRVGEVLKVSRSPMRQDEAFGWAYLKRGAYELGEVVKIDGESWRVGDLDELL